MSDPTAHPPAQPSTAAPAPGERLASYFENFFKTIVGIATLGASLTFNKITDSSLSSLEPLHNNGFSPARTLTLVSVSWLFFVIALGVTSLFASALSLWRPAAVKAFGTQDSKDREKVLWFASVVSALLLALIIVAFLALSLVVVAFAGPPGWVALTFVVLFGILGFGTIIWRSPLRWPSWIVRTVDPEKKVARLGEFLDSPKKRGTGFNFARGTRVESGGERGGGVGGGPPAEQRSPAAAATERRATSQGVGEKSERRLASSSGAAGKERGDYDYTYGRSTSGDYRASSGSYRYGGQRTDGYDMGRYSRASTVISDPYEPGRFGQGSIVYDDGVREGLVMSRYN